jgi:ABC-type microcin C transport system permease subunit YejB
MYNENNIIELTEPAENDTFTVKEFVAIDYGIAVFFVFLFVCTLFTDSSFFTLFTLTGAVVFFLQGSFKQRGFAC